VIARVRRAPRAPLAVAGILATPLFFVALMSFSLWLDRPSTRVGKNGAEILGDPPGSTIAKISPMRPQSFQLSRLRPE